MRLFESIVTTEPSLLPETPVGGPHEGLRRDLPICTRATRAARGRSPRGPGRAEKSRIAAPLRAPP